MDERGRLRMLRLLARLGRATRAEIVAFRDAQLRRMVAHAHARVAEYRRRFDTHGVGPGDVRTAADLPRLPMTSRRDMQGVALRDRLERGADPARLIGRWTSGSSGRPLELYRTWLEARMAMALRLRILHDLGVRVSDRRAGIVMAPHPRHSRDGGLPQRMLMGLGVFRNRRFNMQLGFPAIVDALRRYRPDLLMAYPSVMARLAALITEEVRAELRPRLVITGAEALTPLVREQIARGFPGAAIRDLYGAHEVEMMAWECAGTGLFHVADHGVVLEVLAEGRPAAVGEAGEVVVTGLQNFTMPFVRYRLGDLVRRGPAPCPCGAPFSTIASIEGRTWDTFWLANGRAAHPSLLNRITQNFGRAWVRQLQLVQERHDRVLLQLVPSVAPAQADLDRLREALGDALGPGIELEIRLVSDIEPDPGGKYHMARSLVRDATSDRAAPLPPTLPTGDARAGGREGSAGGARAGVGSCERPGRS